MINFFKNYTWIIIFIICFYSIYIVAKRRKINNNEVIAIIIGIFQGIWLIDYFSIHYFNNMFGKYNNHILGVSIVVQWFFIMKNAYLKISKLENQNKRGKELKKFYLSSTYLILVVCLAIWYALR